MKLPQRIVYLTIAIVVLVIVYFCYYQKFEKLNAIGNVPRLSVKHSNTIFIRKDPECIKQFNKTQGQYFLFQKVDESVSSKLSKFYVYSAFYDNRSGGKVIVISMLEGYPSSFLCIVWFSSNSSRIIKGTVNMIPEGMGRRYTAAFIICPLDVTEPPSHVSIVTQKCSSIHNLVPVEVVPLSINRSEIAVCVTPFNLAYNKVDQFMETISINRLLGASHFFFYNYSTGPDIDRIIAVYKLADLVTVMPFHLPMKVHVWPVPPGYVEEVKYFGQMGALNDCLYRTMGRYRLTVFSDMDEYLVPRRHKSWRQLINTTSRDTTAWLFRNAFFKIEWPSDVALANNATLSGLRAMSLVKVRRTKTVEPAYQRSKLIVDPHFVDVMGVHNVWVARPGSNLHVFSEKDGLCHHYRFWDGIGEQDFVIDYNILRLREEIVGALRENRRLVDLL